MVEIAARQADVVRSEGRVNVGIFEKCGSGNQKSLGVALMESMYVFLIAIRIILLGG